MKNKDKHYLRALLLASISSIGVPVAQATGISENIARKEREGSDADMEAVSEILLNSVLESHPSFGEVLGHTSHSSHGSHTSHTSSSHTSHTSHVSSGFDGGGGGGNKVNSTKVAVTALGGLAGTVALTYFIKRIIKSHAKHVAARKVEKDHNHAYASRDLKGGMYGNDIDRMTDLLIENEVLESWDRTLSHKWSHCKYNRKVKHSVKRMQARMGRQRTGKASTAFQMSLQQWKDTRTKLIIDAATDSLDLMKDRKALLAAAILLVEKGYLKSYDADNITSEIEKSKIVKAYYAFLRNNKLPETSLIDVQKLRLLNSLPNKQK